MHAFVAFDGRPIEKLSFESFCTIADIVSDEDEMSEKEALAFTCKGEGLKDWFGRSRGNKRFSENLSYDEVCKADKHQCIYCRYENICNR